MRDDRRICIGTITAAHGIRGQVKLKSFAQNPEDIFSYPLQGADGLAISLTSCGASGAMLLASIKGIADRNAAEALKGTKLYIEREALPATSENEFYVEDLVGLRVITLGGEDFGTVEALENYGAGDLLEIRHLSGEKQLYAFTRDTFPTVDIENRTVTIVPPEIIEN